MISFNVAKRRHSMLRRVVESSSRADRLADSTWRGVTGAGAHDDEIAVAVADTTPAKFATLLATDDIAAAFATAAVAEAYALAPDPRSSHEARQIAHEGWARFNVLADQAGHKIRGLGGDLSDAWPVFRELQEQPVDEAKLRRIAELAGRMYALLKGQKAKAAPNVPEDITGLKLGGDVRDLVQPEYALLLDEDGEIDVIRRLAERRAVQYSREGTERQGRGPLVIALDESGSMERGRDDWAKSAMTALTRIAWEDKRPVVVVHFSTATRAQRLMPGDYKGLLKAQRTFLDGGTDVGTALDVAVDEVAELSRAGHRGADVVLVSDGGDAAGRVTRSLDAMKRGGVRLFSVAISVPFAGPLRDRASEYIHLSDSALKAGAVDALKGAVL
jgi:hypothetical protein